MKTYYLAFSNNATGSIACYSVHNTFFIVGYVTVPANTPVWTPIAIGLPQNATYAMFVDSDRNSISTNAGRNYLATRIAPASTDLTYGIFGVVF